MRILFISNEYPPETGNGGIGTYTRHAAEGLAARGHNVTVIARSIDSQIHLSFSEGVTLYRVPPEPYPLPSFWAAFIFRQFMRNWFPHFLERISWILAVRRAVIKLSRLQPLFDIIESAECGAESLLVPRNIARKSIIRFHTPWEIIRHLDNLREAPGDRYLLPLVERIVTLRASSCSSPSHAMASEIKNRWNVHKITVIPNPLPVDRFTSATGKEWIYTGRVERRKGVHHLISAYNISCQSHPEIPKLLIIGRPYGTDGNGTSYEVYIELLIKKSPYPLAITWIKGVPAGDVHSHLANSAVAFFPSLWENYPYTCLEAMANGCLAVASDCGGFPEIIIHQHTGLLVKPDDTNALLLAMKWILDNNDRAREIAQSGHSTIKKIASQEAVCKSMELYYESVLKDNQ